MRSQLFLNTRIHLLFFARNRMLLAFGLLVMVVFGLSMIPMFLFETSGDRFNLLRQLAATTSGYAFVFTASLGLFAVSAHLRERSVKLVLTKPCLPETWLASIFLAAILVTFAIYGFVALGAAALSWIWEIPWQSGFLLMAVESACQAVIQMAFLTCLAVAFHPVVAVLMALFFNEGAIYQLKFLLTGGIASGGDTPGLTLATVLCDTLYMVLPMISPFEKELDSVRMSLRATGGDWLTLLGVLGYTAFVTVFLFLLSDYLLRRKNLI